MHRKSVGSRICGGFFVVAVFINLLYAQDNPWQCNGPYGSHVSHLAASTSPANTVYAVTTFGLYRSENYGENWIFCNPLELFSECFIWDIAVNPTDAHTLYLATNKGIYKSNNGGISWTLKGLQEKNVYTLTLSSHNSGVILVSTFQGESPWFHESSAIYKSINGGDSWTKIFTGGDFGDIPADIIINPNDPDHIYAARNGTYEGFLKSTDGGNEWQEIPVSGSGFTWDKGEYLAITPQSYVPETIYWMGTKGISSHSIYKSTDRGESWTSLFDTESPDLIGQVSVMAVDPAHPDLLYVGGTIEEADVAALLWYSQSLNEWSYTIDGLPSERSIHCLPSDIVATVSENPHWIFVSYKEGGIYAAETSPDNFTPANNGMPAPVLDLVPFSTDGNSMICALDGDGFPLAVTHDGGHSWNFLPDSPIGMKAIKSSPHDPNVLYCGDNILFKSENGGLSWEKISGFRNFITDIWTSSENPDLILVSTATPFYQSTGEPGIHRTADGGETWDYTLEHFATVIRHDPQNPQTLYCGTRSGGYVFKSTDEGVTWEFLSPKGDWVEKVYDLCTDRSSHLYAATDDGLRRWDGSTWTVLSGLPTNDIHAVTVDTSQKKDIIYAGTGGEGVYYSTDHGETWLTYRQGLDNKTITCFAFMNHTATQLCAGAEHGGVWINTPVAVSVNSTGATTLPSNFRLQQNYPNPFNPYTVIRYQLPHPTRVKLTIHDVLGHEIVTLTDNHQQAGQYHIKWDGRDQHGDRVTSGIYFCRLVCEGYEQTIKMTVVE